MNKTIIEELEKKAFEMFKKDIFFCKKELCGFYEIYYCKAREKDLDDRLDFLFVNKTKNKYKIIFNSYLRNLYINHNRLLEEKEGVDFEDEFHKSLLLRFIGFHDGIRFQKLVEKEKRKNR